MTNAIEKTVVLRDITLNLITFTLLDYYYFFCSVLKVFFGGGAASKIIGLQGWGEKLLRKKEIHYLLEIINQIHQPFLPTPHTNEWSLIKTKTKGSGHSIDQILKRWVLG